MRKAVIIGLIIVFLAIGVTVYTCNIRAQSPDKAIGGIYTGQVIATGQDAKGFTTVYFSNAAQKPLVMKGFYQFQIGQVYVIQTKEVTGGLEIISIQIKK
jgi:hypothetical protein